MPHLTDTAAASAGWGANRAAIAEYFSRRAAESADDLGALDYGSRESQQIRFEILAESLPRRPLRLLDVGCGLADFAAFLAESRGDVEYYGVDLCPEFIERARRRQPKLALAVLDILSDRSTARYDAVIANGIFYLLRDDPVATMRRLIERMFDLSAYVVAFTSLSTRSPMQTPGEFHADPIETLRFCQTLSPIVVLRHDYLPHDFAVYLYRERPR